MSSWAAAAAATVDALAGGAAAGNGVPECLGGRGRTTDMGGAARQRDPRKHGESYGSAIGRAEGGRALLRGNRHSPEL